MVAVAVRDRTSPMRVLAGSLKLWDWFAWVTQMASEGFIHCCFCSTVMRFCFAVESCRCNRPVPSDAFHACCLVLRCMITTTTITRFYLVSAANRFGCLWDFGQTILLETPSQDWSDNSNSCQKPMPQIIHSFGALFTTHQVEHFTLLPFMNNIFLEI